MIKEFFKRTVIALTAIFMLAVYCCAGAVFLRPPKGGDVTAYFLVDRTDSVAASMEMVSLRGGAGYLMATGAVALNVYFSELEAQSALSGILSEYPTAKIESYAKKGGFNDEEKFLFSAVKMVEGWGQVLKEGVSQSRIREGLREVAATLDYRFRGVSDKRCKAFLEELSICADGIITIGKVRYFLCFAAERLWECDKKGII